MSTEAKVETAIADEVEKWLAEKADWQRRNKVYAENLFGCAPSDFDTLLPCSFLIEINRRAPQLAEVLFDADLSGDPYMNAVADAQWEGAERLSAELLKELEDWRRDFTHAKGHAPKLPQAIAARIALLVVYCGSIGRPPPPSLQRLVAASYGFTPGTLAHEVQRGCGIAPGVDDLEAFLTAATLDGLADEEGRTLSVADVARRVGASRKSVRRWREMPEYQGRRQWVFNPAYRKDGDPVLDKASELHAAQVRDSLCRSRPDLFAS